MVVSLTFLQNANMQVLPLACCCYHVWLVMLGVERSKSDRLCMVDLTFRGSGMTEHYSQYKSLENTEFRILELLCPGTERVCNGIENHQPHDVIFDKWPAPPIPKVALPPRIRSCSSFIDPARDEQRLGCTQQQSNLPRHSVHG